MKQLGLLVWAALTIAWSFQSPTIEELPGERSSITGELIDLDCFATAGRRGPNHAACAKACALSGSPLGLLDDRGGVRLLVGDHKDLAALRAAKGLAGRRVVVTGALAQPGGLPAIVATSVTSAP